MIDPSVEPDIHDEISINEASHFIAKRCGILAGMLRIEKCKIRNRIKYAVDTNALYASRDNKLRFGELVNWGRSVPEWAMAFVGLKCPNSGHGNATLPALTTRSGGSNLPKAVDDCHEMIVELNTRVFTLQDQVFSLQVEVIRLREYESHQQEKNLINQRSASKPRLRRQ